MFILTILLIVYVLAVNFYAFLMMREIKKEKKTGASADRTNGKLALTGALGGAITIYVCMFVFKYRLNNLFLMIVMPILSVINVWFWFIAVKNGFGFLGI